MNSNKKTMAGFTLLEAMIVAVIVGILFALSFPAYQQYSRKARRAECQTVMLSYANALERMYATTGSYISSDISSGFNCPSNGGDSTYELAFDPQPTKTTYTITAEPQGKSQVQDKCGTLTLNQSGVKGVSGSTVADCW